MVIRGGWSGSPSSLSAKSSQSTGGASPPSHGEEDERPSDERPSDERPSMGDDDRDRLQFPCGECKKGKVRCDYRIPCSRCFRLGRECRAQDRAKRGRPVKVKEYDAASSKPSHREDGSHYESPSSPDETTPRSRGRGPIVKQEGGGRAGDPAYFTIYVSVSPVEMYIYRHAGQVIVRTTSKMKKEGSLDIPRAVASTLMVNAYSTKIGKDVSLGVTEAGYNIVGINSFPPMNPSDPKLHASDSLKREEGKGQFTFDRLPLYIRELWGSWIASTVTVLWEGDYFNFCNPVFEDQYWSTEEARALIKDCGILNLLTLARLFHPDDLEDVYEALSYYMLGPPEPLKEMTKICKCISKQGVSRLSLVRYRLVLLPGGGAAGVLSLIPLPRSPYFRELPSSMPPFQPYGDMTMPMPRAAAPPRPPLGTPPILSPPASTASYASSRQGGSRWSFPTPPTTEMTDDPEMQHPKPAMAIAVGVGAAEDMTLPPGFDFDAFLQAGGAIGGSE